MFIYKMELKRILRLIAVIIVIVIVSWGMSNTFHDTLDIHSSTKKWVYIEIKKVLPRDTTDYFYYGQINESLIEKINAKEDLSGLFILSNIRYWNDDDLLTVYEDKEHYDSRIFQIHDIQTVVPYKDDPINLFNMEELHESSKALRDTIK